MNFDVRSTRQGKCEACGSVGLLLRVPVLSPQAIMPLTFPPPILNPSFDIQDQCLGCIEGRVPQDELDADTIE